MIKTKKRLLLIISVLLLTICALGFMVYKLVYKNWYNKNSLKIVYYENLDKHKSSEIYNSKYLFIMNNTNKKLRNDYIVNEKGQIVSLQEKGFSDKYFQTKIGVNGRYIEMLGYDSNDNHKSDVYIFNKKLELIEKYNSIPGSLNEIMTYNEIVVGEYKGKLVYFYDSALYTYNSQNHKKELLKKFDNPHIYMCCQSCDNTDICIINGGDYGVRFYSISDDKYSSVYNLTNIGMYFSPQDYYSHTGKMFGNTSDSFIIRPKLNHYYINKIINEDQIEPLYNVVDSKGKIVIDDQYKECNQFYCGCARVTDKNGNSYFIDINKKKVPAPKDTDEYIVQYKLSDNVFCASKKGIPTLWFLINQEGKILRSLRENEQLYEFADGYSFIYNYKDMNGFIINEKGEITVDMWKDVYSKYPNLRKSNKKTAREYIKQTNIDLPSAGFSDSGLFFDNVLDDKGNIIQVVFNSKGEIQFACSADYINGVVRIAK